MDALTLYPAIDLKEGSCVRLLHGEMDAATVYNEDPAAQASAFLDDGFSWIHIVDLDGAFAGKSQNGTAIEAIIKAAPGMKLQLGGGIRSMATVERWLSLGVNRVILGTAAVKNPDFVREAGKAFPNRIVIGVDAREGRVKTDGWDGDTGHTVLEIIKRYEDQGVAAVIFTDIGRDGALGGVNVEATMTLAGQTAIPVIASGGVAGSADITSLATTKTAIEGVIVGRALYDGRLTAKAALSAANRT